MEFRQLIENAQQIVGTRNELATLLGVHVNCITDAKRGRIGLPIAACGKLADILAIDRWTVVAASDLVTEKNKERIAYLRPFVLRHAKIAAICIMTMTSALSNDDYNSIMAYDSSDSSCFQKLSMGRYA